MDTGTASIRSSIEEKFDYGDKRLDSRARKLLEMLALRQGGSLAQALHERRDYEAALRFFDNDLVTVEKILDPHFQATVDRCAGAELVLVAQDTSDLDYDYLQVDGFGSTSSNVDQGYRIHPSLVITESGVPLGLIGYDAYTRSPEDEAVTKHRNCLPIEAKESYRWLKGYRRACHLAMELGADTTVVSISDREGDIYEVFSEAEGAAAGDSAHVLVRAQHNRNLDENGRVISRGLKNKLLSSPVLDKAELTVDRGKKNERVVEVAMHACGVVIKAPHTANKKTEPSISVNAVLVSEVTSKKKKVQWLLLTTLPIDSLDEVRRVVDLYSKRWQIEVYFKVLKSGCGIDRIRFQTRERIEKYIAFCLLVAWRVMMLAYLSREFPDEPCTILFSEVEWKLAYTSIYRDKRRVPKKPPKLKELAILIGQMGGYKKRKTPPGIITIWRGISRLVDMCYGYEMAMKTISAR